MRQTRLKAVHDRILPLLEPLDKEVVQPGLEIATATMARVRSDLDCPEKAAWVAGSHRHAALHGKLARFAERQQGWIRRVESGMPIYNIGNGIELTVKRTEQGRAASNARGALPVDEFELEGHEQTTFLIGDLNDSPIMHVVALDYVVRSDGQCLTAMLQRRGAKLFIPLAYVLSKSILALPAQELADVAGPKRPVIRVLRKKAEG